MIGGREGYENADRNGKNVIRAWNRMRAKMEILKKFKRVEYSSNQVDAACEESFHFGSI